MNTLRRLFFLAAVLLCGPVLAQSVVYVDAGNCPGPGTGAAGDPFCTITAAITAAATGDTVQVLPGTYSECVNTTDKGLAIVADDTNSALDASSFIIDGDGSCTTVNLGGNSSLDGFTVRNGGDSGIRAFGSVSITNNIISGNSSPEYGGGLYIVANAGAGYYFDYGDVTISVENNSIDGNSSTADGGGAYLYGIGTGNSVSMINFNANTVTGNSLVGDPGFISSQGGGISAYTNTGVGAHSEILISQNMISTNTADFGDGFSTYGGGIFANTFGFGSELITIEENTLSGNSVEGFGGGISAWAVGDSQVNQNHVIVVDDNTVTGNSASENGGGLDLYIEATDMRVGRNVELSADGNIVQTNDAVFSGGGIVLTTLTDDNDNDNNPATTTTVTVFMNNNLVTQNSTDGFGGGLDLFLATISDTESTVDMDYNTIAGNTAAFGAGGVSITSGTEADPTETGTVTIQIENSIIADNVGHGIALSSDESEGILDLDGIEYNLVYGHSPDDYDTAVSTLADIANSTNITADPQLDGTWGPDVCSPAIDGADPADDFSSEPEPNGDRANLGYLGGTSEATTILPDTNGDGAIDGLDILELATAFASSMGQTRYSASADIDLNGTVEGSDLAQVAARFGKVCP
ncbi:MAG: hypothetical protein IFK94_13310 [Acidobacteria bacterium]|uniref:Probable pectate lyase C n=1 Tax=Candidatus Polarisedimenticola svalbardensis TaxID=2886004 RepID=A0A8J6Y489_9BACT|nr:hypothetical protein [Candidatus Polarisedimenticola svalbardensis]